MQQEQIGFRWDDVGADHVQIFYRHLRGERIQANVHAAGIPLVSVRGIGGTGLIGKRMRSAA